MVDEAPTPSSDPDYGLFTWSPPIRACLPDEELHHGLRGWVFVHRGGHGREPVGVQRKARGLLVHLRSMADGQAVFGPWPGRDCLDDFESAAAWSGSQGNDGDGPILLEKLLGWRPKIRADG